MAHPRELLNESGSSSATTSRRLSIPNDVSTLSQRSITNPAPTPTTTGRTATRTQIGARGISSHAPTIGIVTTITATTITIIAIGESG